MLRISGAGSLIGAVGHGRDEFREILAAGSGRSRWLLGVRILIRVRKLRRRSLRWLAKRALRNCNLCARASRSCNAAAGALTRRAMKFAPTEHSSHAGKPVLSASRWFFGRALLGCATWFLRGSTYFSKIALWNFDRSGLFLKRMGLKFDN